MEKLDINILQSKFKKWPLIFLLILLPIIIVGLSFSIYFTFFDCIYIQLNVISLSIIPATFIYIIVNGLLQYYKHINIKNNTLTITNIFGWNLRSYHLNNLQSFAEMDMRDKYSSWKELRLIYPEETIRLSSMVYKNYSQLAALLISDKEDNTYEYLRKRKKSMWLAIAFHCMVFTIICLPSLYYSPIIEQHELTKEELQEIKGVLSEEPQINGRNDYGNQNAYYVLKEYPEMAFYLNRTNFYNSANEDLEKELHTNDTVYFTIAKDEYQAKLAKTKPLSFEQKHFEFTTIDVYGISDNKLIYLDKEESEKLVTSGQDIESGLVIALFFIGGCISLLIILQYSECIQSKKI